MNEGAVKTCDGFMAGVGAEEKMVGLQKNLRFFRLGKGNLYT